MITTQLVLMSVVSEIRTKYHQALGARLGAVAGTRGPGDHVEHVQEAIGRLIMAVEA